MIGEHFDKIRNYIDNYNHFYSKSYRNYNESGSKSLTIPNEVLPMIGKNFGWDFVNPYTGSLEEYFIGVSDNFSAPQAELCICLLIATPIISLTRAFRPCLSV